MFEKVGTTFARWALLALSLCLGCAGAARRPGYRSDGIPLDEDEVRAEIATVERALQEVYAGRAMMTRESWALMVRELHALPPDHQTSDTFCAALAEVLRRMAPSVEVLDRRGDRCVIGGVAKREASGGENLSVALNAKIAVREWSGGITAIGIQSFDASAALPEGTLAAIERAKAVVIDLRNAKGDDPRPALPILEELLGTKPLLPLRGIVVRSTPLAATVRAQVPSDQLRVRSAWDGLVGTSSGARKPRPRAKDKPLFVLVGGTCDAPCQLVALLLRASANTHLVGIPTNGRGLFLTDAGELTLGRSAIRLRLPTALYDPSDELSAILGSVGGTWSSLTLLPLSGFPPSDDLLEQALAVARTEIDRRERALRFEANPPPPCASLPTASPTELPETALRRLSGGTWHPPPHHLSVYVTLSAERAREFISGCPGLEVQGVAEHPSLTIVHLAGAPFTAASRLFRSDVVELISVSPYHPVHPN
jgi:hypothetical protein